MGKRGGSQCKAGTPPSRKPQGLPKSRIDMKQDDYDNERPQSQMTDAAAAAHARPGACSEYSQAPTHTDDEVSSATADHTGSELVGTTSTSLTSFMEPQSASFSIPDLEVDEDYEDPSDTASMYAPSQYPRAPTAHLRERPYDLATVTSSRSLWEGDLDYVIENGRRYCGDYYMPNDETEQDRLRILHQVYLYIFDRKLTTVELNNPTNILDIGTGTGDWAIGMGELYPNCDVVGTDISAIQPTAVPHNVYFEIDNAEMEWTRPPDTYDLIHFRNMVGAFSDWPFVYSQAFTCLKPGGYIEIVELDERAGLKDFYALLDQSSDTYRLIADTFIAAAKSGRPRGMAHAEPRLLMEAGFVDVRLQEFSVPLSVTDSMQACGKLWLVACLAAVEALSLRLVTRYMGWTPERARAACEDVISALRALALDTSGRAKDHIVKVRVLTGRKPDAFPGQESAQRIRPDGAIDHGLPSPHSRASSSEFDVQPPEVDENLLADGNGSGDVDMAGCASDASSVTPKGKEKALPEDNGPIGDGSTS